MSDTAAQPGADVTLDLNVGAPFPTSTSAKSTEPYVVRILTFTFQLEAGKVFSGTGSDTVTLTGLRATAHVELANLPTPGLGIFRIWGMTLDDMNILSAAGRNYQAAAKNSVLVQAGDDVSGLTTIFQGKIVEAWPDFSGAPDTNFFVNATPSLLIQLKPVQPNTFTGGTSVATALQQITQSAGLTLENNGVNTILASPYFPGSCWDQINAAVRAANCFAFLDGINDKLAIWPKDGSRAGGDPSVISPANGMIGYPMFQQNLVKVRTLFNPSVSLTSGAPGNVIKIQSQLTAANGMFTVIDVTHDLASQLPDGPWETLITCNPKN